MVTTFRYTRFVCCAAAWLLLANCGDPEHKRLDLAADSAVGPLYALRGPEVTNLAEDNTDYAAALYRSVGHRPGNFIVSPYSTAVALAMIYTGAQSETARQMAGAMRWGGGRPRALAPRRRPERTPQTQPRPAPPVPAPAAPGSRSAPKRVPTFLHQANAVWVQKGTPMREEYAPMVAIAFGALAASVDFYGNPFAATTRINQWAAEQTDDAVGEMVPEHFIDRGTRLLVTSALRLTAAWRSPFDAALTAQGRFVNAAGTAREVPMMRVRQNLRISQGFGYRAVEIPYASEQFGMLVIVPDELAGFEADLTASVIDEAVGRLQSETVDLVLPRFALQDTMSLRPVLQELGMTRAFHSGEADLGGIDRTHHLFLSDVIHHADLRVDEAGTYATAAVGSPGAGSNMFGSSVESFVVDRPFIFMVRDTDSGAPLFLGRVIDPS